MAFRITRKLGLITVIVTCFVSGWAQSETSNKLKKEVSTAGSQTEFRSSAAYAELLLRRTELTSALESLVVEYTEEYPKVKEMRYVLSLLDRDSGRLAKVKPAEQSKLTLALGKLMVRKLELETDLWNLQKNYKDEHPDVKRAKRKVEIYETAIGEILN